MFGRFWHLQMPYHYISVFAPHYLRLFTLWTLCLRKPRSWSHVATVQQNTDRDYGAHSRLQIQMLYSTLATGQRSRGMRTGSLYMRVGTVGAFRCGSWSSTGRSMSCRDEDPVASSPISCRLFASEEGGDAIRSGAPVWTAQICGRGILNGTSRP